MNNSDWQAQPSADNKMADPQPGSSLVYVDQAEMKVEDYVEFGRRLYFLWGSVITLFLWRRHRERNLTYGLLLSFCLHWAYWQTRQKVVYNAYVKTYGQPPPRCHQDYNCPWTSVSDHDLEECEAYRRLIAAAPSPVGHPLFEVAELVHEVILEPLRTISTTLHLIAIALLMSRIPLAAPLTLILALQLPELVADDSMRPE
ncbi:hypothetical protein V5799_021629 [Amblyomma americanum]|uniref:Uncharacterized protein n=1 Tax=Amblyomma americanum TaxID=6943 RepID=A0AAQ4FPB2_AMBAM